MHDLINSVSVLQVIAPQNIQAGPVNGAVIDMQGAESLAVIAAIGNIADALDATHRLDLKIEHADDNGQGQPGSYAACTSADLIGAAATGGVFAAVDAAGKKNARHTVAYNGGKRFVRVSAVPVSLATGGPAAVIAIKGNLAQRPVA